MGNEIVVESAPLVLDLDVPYASPGLWSRLADKSGQQVCRVRMSECRRMSWAWKRDVP